MSSIALKLAEARQKIGTATLVAVSKMQDTKAIREALAAGQRAFGENRVQEAQKKFISLKQEFPDIQLHLIGPLQTNKAEDAVALFDVIETLDRPALADALAKAILRTGKTPRLYIEVNIGAEPQKAGVAPDKLEEFVTYCRDAGLSISGLMCIPPNHEDPRPYFEALRDLAAHLSLPHLSMGMSGDFEAALSCGATEARLGTAIFGERTPTVRTAIG